MIDWSLLNQQKIAIAISGGADSFALLHMAKQAGAKITALTVDHRLRAESADEAEQVAAWCVQNNIEHFTLPWVGEKPKSALQANARNARRRLLCDKCNELDIDTLLLAHQADDQAETMLMRLQRGTGLKGLKAMQSATCDKATGVTILRPLLHLRRSELRDYCLQNDLPFIDDPSNEDPFFERVRIRHVLEKFPKLVTGMTRSAERLRRADETVQYIAQQWVKAHAEDLDDEETWLPDVFLDLLPELRLRALESFCPGLELAQLEKLDEAMQQDDFAGITFGGFWVKPKVLQKKQGFIIKKAPARNSVPH